MKAWVGLVAAAVCFSASSAGYAAQAPSGASTITEVPAISRSGTAAAPPPSKPSIKLTQQAAAQGFPASQYQVARGYLYGIGGLPKDAKSGMHWLTQSALMGYPPAESLLGEIYAFGQLGQPTDVGRAVPLLRAAANEGDSRAAHNLAALYYSGAPGLPQDSVRGTHWLRMAVFDGDAAMLATVQGQRTEPAAALILGYYDQVSARQLLRDTRTFPYKTWETHQGRRAYPFPMRGYYQNRFGDWIGKAVQGLEKSITELTPLAATNSEAAYALSQAYRTAFLLGVADPEPKKTPNQKQQGAPDPRAGLLGSTSRDLADTWLWRAARAKDPKAEFELAHAEMTNVCPALTGDEIAFEVDSFLPSLPAQTDYSAMLADAAKQNYWPAVAFYGEVLSRPNESSTPTPASEIGPFGEGITASWDCSSTRLGVRAIPPRDAAVGLRALQLAAAHAGEQLAGPHEIDQSVAYLVHAILRGKGSPAIRAAQAYAALQQAWQQGRVTFLAYYNITRLLEHETASSAYAPPLADDLSWYQSVRGHWLMLQRNALAADVGAPSTVLTDDAPYQRSTKLFFFAVSFTRQYYNSYQISTDGDPFYFETVKKLMLRAAEGEGPYAACSRAVIYANGMETFAGTTPAIRVKANPAWSTAWLRQTQYDGISCFRYFQHVPLGGEFQALD